MSIVLLRDSLRPRYFISYSRAQLEFAQQLRQRLDGVALSIWHDLEQMAHGDDIRAEIECGIRGCDEIVLLVCERSVTSEWVRYEIEMADATDRMIRPIIVQRPGSPLPPRLAGLHHVDVSAATIRSGVTQARAELGATTAVTIAQLDQSKAAWLFKRQGCRTTWPIFDTNLISRAYRARVLEVSRCVDAVAQRHVAGSLFTLNAGLLGCAGESWDRGLARLAAFAEASGTFAGWYYYALHINRERNVRNLGLQREALRAVDNAASFGVNPLCMLLRIIYNISARNTSDRRLDRELGEFLEARRAADEPPAEYLRFYWCMKSSLPAFGAHEPYVRRLIRSIASRAGDDS